MMEKLKRESIWLNWRLETRGGKTTKIPYQRDDRFASSTDSKTWCTFDEAKNVKNFSGVGIVFEPSQGVVGVDFDHCVLETGIPKHILSFLDASNTYCEYSPSKTGFHVLFILKEDVELESHKHYFDETSHVEV